MKGRQDSLQILSRRLRHFIKRNARGGIFADANKGVNTKINYQINDKYTKISRFKDLCTTLHCNEIFNYKSIKTFYDLMDS